MAECRCFLDGDGVCTSCGQRRVHAVTADVSDWHGALAYLSQHGFDVDAVLRDAALNVTHWKADPSDVNAPITEMDAEPPADADSLIDELAQAIAVAGRTVIIEDKRCADARAALKARIQPAPALDVDALLLMLKAKDLEIDRLRDGLRALNSDFREAVKAGMEKTPAASLKPWTLRLVCCGRDAGVEYFDTWKEADAFRESYCSGPGVGHGGHQRSAIMMPRQDDHSPSPVPPVAPPENPDLDALLAELERQVTMGASGRTEVSDYEQDKRVIRARESLRAALTRPKVTAEALAAQVFAHLKASWHPSEPQAISKPELAAALRALETP